METRVARAFLRRGKKSMLPWLFSSARPVFARAEDTRKEDNEHSTVIHLSRNQPSPPLRPFLLYPFFRRDSVCNCSPLSKLIVTGGEAAVQRRGSTPRNFVRSVHPPRAPSSSAFPGYHLHNFAAASTCTIAYIGSCPSGGPKLVHPGRRAWMSRGFGAAENWFEIYRESRACG